MDFFFKFIAFMFLVSVVQSTKNGRNVTFFKLNENIIYDCVDIYKQPSLSYSLLKNHKIQMEPSFLISKIKNKAKSKSKSEYESKKILECPNGTVPILRNTKEYVTNAQYWAEKHFSSFTVESPGAHIAGFKTRDKGPYYGLEAWMSVHDLNITKDQISYATIYVGDIVDNTINFIHIGWMINPSVFGDGRPWRYGLWKGAYGKGCYNTMCPGFVQVSKTNPLSGPIPYPRKRKGDRALYVGLQKDKKSGNWWASYVREFGWNIPIGYWPQELFNLINKSANVVGVGGFVQASPSGINPPMGNGHLPTKDEYKSARVKNLQIIDTNFKVRESYNYKFEKMLDNNKCYGLRNRSDLFNYGGPGGESCGI